MKPRFSLIWRVAGVVPIDQARAGSSRNRNWKSLSSGSSSSAWRFSMPSLRPCASAAGRSFFSSSITRSTNGSFFASRFSSSSAQSLAYLGVSFWPARDQVEQLVGVILHVDAAAVQHDGGGLDAGGELDGLDRVALGQLALAGALGGELVEVGRGVVHAHRQRAEIVQAGNPYLARVHGLEDAGQQADARAVAQFGVFESPGRGFRAAWRGRRCADGNSSRWKRNT